MSCKSQKGRKYIKWRESLEGGKEQEELGEVKGAERQTGGKGQGEGIRMEKRAVDGMGDEGWKGKEKENGTERKGETER